MSTCQDCRFWRAGDNYPHYDRQGACMLIHATGTPQHRPAQIHPVGNAWLTTMADFGCTLHEKHNDR